MRLSRTQLKAIYNTAARRRDEAYGFASFSTGSGDAANLAQGYQTYFSLANGENGGCGHPR